jgi:hypothetical protein
VDLIGVRAIGVDEAHWQHGPHFLALVYQIDAARKLSLDQLALAQDPAAAFPQVRPVGTATLSGTRHSCSCVVVIVVIWLELLLSQRSSCRSPYQMERRSRLRTSAVP